MTALTINRLAEREIAAMIDRVAGNKPLPANIRQDIAERTDGIPLFVEEMTKAVLEAESEGEARRTAAAVPAPAWLSPRACRRHSCRGSTGSAPPRRLRRSGRLSARSSPMRCSPR